MKKVLSILLMIVLVTGCTNIKEASYDELIDEAIDSKVDIQNTYRKGYKFYLPDGMKVVESNDYNEKISGDDTIYYLYIDLISYLDKETVEHKSENAEFYKALARDDNTGYVEVKKYQDRKYLVEIVYNYAKIEVIVDRENTKNAVARSMAVLASIKYNDSFLKSLSEESLLNYKEEAVDLFDKSGSSESNFLEYADELDDYDGANALPDYDMIN